MNTNQAIHMIQDHGHKAFATPDGLLAMSNALNGPAPLRYEDEWTQNGQTFLVSFHGDTMFEESTVFEVRDDGTVDSLAIRRWLGY